MTIDKDRAGRVDTSWPAVIDAETGVLDSERYKLGSLVLTVHKNPRMLGSSDLTYVPWAVSVKRNGLTIVLVQIEQEDLHALSEKLRCPIRELKEERGVKGALGKPRVVCYSEDGREDLGPYDEKIDLVGAKACLIEWACDIVDAAEDPVPLS